MAVASEGEKLGDVVIPGGMVGFATVCSVTINGVLLKSGVPTESKFGGVLEVRDSKPRRFVAIINYGGTTLDPSEQIYPRQDDKRGGSRQNRQRQGTGQFPRNTSTSEVNS